MRIKLPKWKDKLQGVPAFIVANGPSLSDHDLLPLSNRFTIGVNRAFYALDPTILLWQDVGLLKEHAEEVKASKALKVCRVYSDYGYNLAKYRFDPHTFGVPLEAMKSSGTAAYALAALLGCSPIVLIGFDCCYREGRTDFYGKNENHNALTLPNCLAALQWLKAQSSEVINCSANEVVKPRMSLAEALTVIGDRGLGTREEFIGQLGK